MLVKRVITLQFLVHLVIWQGKRYSHRESPPVTMLIYRPDFPSFLLPFFPRVVAERLQNCWLCQNQNGQARIRKTCNIQHQGS